MENVINLKTHPNLVWPIWNVGIGQVPEEAELVLDEKGRVLAYKLGLMTAKYKSAILKMSALERKAEQVKNQAELGVTNGV